MLSERNTAACTPSRARTALNMHTYAAHSGALKAFDQAFGLTAELVKPYELDDQQALQQESSATIREYNNILCPAKHCSHA